MFTLSLASSTVVLWNTRGASTELLRVHVRSRSALGCQRSQSGGGCFRPQRQTNDFAQDSDRPHEHLSYLSRLYDEECTMGIGGLLPLLKSIQVQQHLSEFGGKTVAVDAYVWLHRGVFTCATELATGKPTSKCVYSAYTTTCRLILCRYVDYFMQRVRLLRHHGITPYIVFDGGPLPAKRGTEVERRARRADHKAKGDSLARQGRQKEAREYYCKSVDVTPQMAFQVIKVWLSSRVTNNLSLTCTFRHCVLKMSTTWLHRTRPTHRWRSSNGRASCKELYLRIATCSSLGVNECSTSSTLPRPLSRPSRPLTWAPCHLFAAGPQHNSAPWPSLRVETICLIYRESGSRPPIRSCASTVDLTGLYGP